MRLGSGSHSDCTASTGGCSRPKSPRHRHTSPSSKMETGDTPTSRERAHTRDTERAPRRPNSCSSGPTSSGLKRSRCMRSRPRTSIDPPTSGQHYLSCSPRSFGSSPTQTAFTSARSGSGASASATGFQSTFARQSRTPSDKLQDYDRLQLNVALAYGGRAELLGAAREIAARVEDGELAPDEIDVETVQTALPDGPTQAVDLIVRTGGDERTSNFLPWQAKGNEAAVYFCAPYWPEFRKIDFMRGLRTYAHREQSWRRSRARRARTLLTALPGEYPDARATLAQFWSALPGEEQEESVDADGLAVDPAD
ncbi:MAG: undecaprenyl pyrophosphate synthase [halophilic archaeon J07HX5]|nr:MAG: undecaprenyl pyrophosphate synthase [halophilic archaeon J07HX5]